MNYLVNKSAFPPHLLYVINRVYFCSCLNDSDCSVCPELISEVSSISFAGIYSYTIKCLYLKKKTQTTKTHRA